MTTPFPFKKDQVAKFFYWIAERESIRQKKEAGKPWPWTKDKILREYKFTNVFRRQDRTTLELVKRVERIKDPVELYIHINTFRLFNWTETYDEMVEYIIDHEWSKMTKFLHARKERGEQLWTGAYMIHASPGAKKDKIDDYMETVVHMAEEAERKVKVINFHNSLEITTQKLQRYNHVGPFIAYELACDYSYFSKLLGNCGDRYTWANTGPGAARGIHRLLTGRHEKPQNGINYVGAMRQLLHMSDGKGWLPGYVKKLEMRDIEHSLCEFDKYSRVANDEGRSPKQKYKPPGEH